MKYFTLNRVFIAYAIIFLGIISGVLPREVAIPTIIFLLIWSALVPLSEATLFFIRSVPLFIAIPLTASYDNLNMWRPLALVLFARMLWEIRLVLRDQVRELRATPAIWLKAHPTSRRLAMLFILAALSLIGAAYPVTGAIRIIYVANLLMVPLVIYALIQQGRLTVDRVITNLAIPTMMVIVVGYLQLISTYLIDIYQFMRLWGEEIQFRQFGTEWSYIAVNVGNTWLAYYGSQLSLRVFSLFPDSHSFPTFVLLSMPALFALSPRARNIWVPLAFLIVILSGTRGIWAAAVGILVLTLLLWWFLRRRELLIHARWLMVFFTLFAVAWPIFISPQFLLSKGDWRLLSNRIRSVIDFGETSNALRLKIWEASVRSIARHPFLGVGIGNFPVVLDQRIELARAGSTAHNLYLHVAAEMGIFAALEMIVLLVAAWWNTVKWFRRATGRAMIYAGAMTLYLPWILAYVMTDPIIFDERVFLMFATALALIFAHE